MGYSGRYHAASLAAVFLALAIGILIGVGLGHNVLSGAQRDLETSLKSDLANTRGKNQALQGELNQAREFGAQIYPGLAGNLLSGKRIAVIALGGLPDGLRRSPCSASRWTCTRLPPTRRGRGGRRWPATRMR
jgi:hypothetical protein